MRSRNLLSLVHKNEPTGFHLIIALKREVSCSSVQRSGRDTSCVSFAPTDVGGSSAAFSAASPVGLEAALEGTRPFLLGGIEECQ